MEAAATRLSSASWSEPASKDGADRSAKIRCGTLRGLLSCDAPATGLRELNLGGTAFAGSLLKVTAAGGELAVATENYVRGKDHVSTHLATDSFPFRTQLYWSAVSLSDGGVAVTLTVSLQTDLLDTRPELSFTTLVEGATSEERGNTACLKTAAGPCLVMTPHPTDAVECEVHSSGNEAIVRFVPPFLEKGVIRRLRVAVLVLPSDTSEEAITGALAEFAAAPLPLTT